MQAQLYCKPDVAKKIIASLLLVCLAAQAVKDTVWFHADVNTSITVIHSYLILFNIAVPFILLVINLTVVHEVCRQTTHEAETSIGRQSSLQHQQPTTFSHALPTIFLTATSLIYVVVSSTWFMLYYVYWWTQYADVASPDKTGLQSVYLIAEEAHCFVFSCAFYVYLVRGKQFRSDVRKLICQCRAAADTDSTVSRRGQSNTAL